MAVHRPIRVLLALGFLLAGVLAFSGPPDAAAVPASPATHGAWKEFAAVSATGSGISDTSDDSGLPSMAIAPDGTAWVAWEDGDGEGTSNIYVRYWNGSVWVEADDTTPGGGISNSGGANAPSLAIGPDGRPWVAWQDYDINYPNDTEIYLRRWTGSDWVGVGGSGTGGGLSNNFGDSYEPSLAFDAGGYPVVAWEDDSGGESDYSEIYVRRYEGDGWKEMNNSASSGGISNTVGASRNASLDVAPDGTLWVAWDEDTSLYYGIYDIYVRHWKGSGWEEVGGSASEGGISDSEYGADAIQPSLAIAPDGAPWVAWTNNHSDSFDSDIYLRRLNGTVWEERDNSASGGGISETGLAGAPSLAIASDGTAWVAWQDYDDSDYEAFSETYLRRWSGSAWVEVGTSASKGGVSNSANAYVPSLAIAPDGAPWVAWMDYDDFWNGNWEIHARRWNSVAWVEIGGSASAGGLSNSSGNSFRPSVAVNPNNGLPYVAWADNGSSDWPYSEVYVRRWNGSAWVQLGRTASDGGFGTSAFRPSLAIAPNGTPWVAWSEEDDEGFADIYVRRWNGTNWVEVDGSASEGGISNSGRASWPSLAIDPDGVPWVAWADVNQGNSEIYVRRLIGGNWVGVGGSASGGGISNSSGASVQPALAIDPDGVPWVAWVDNSKSDRNEETYVRTLSGTTWIEMNGSASGGGISNNNGRTNLTYIAIGPDGVPWVVWDDHYTGLGGLTYSEVFVRHWDGATWAESSGSATGAGISNSGGFAYRPAVAVDADGAPWVAWSDSRGGNGETYVRRWDDATWAEVDASASSGGISNSAGISNQPAVALAADGTAFVSWQDDSSGDPDIYIRYYTPPPCYFLRLGYTGEGGDPVASPANSTGCAAGEYLAGETITLTAAPAVGWRVTNWIGTANDTTASMTNMLTMPAGEHTAGVAYAFITPSSCFALHLGRMGEGGVPVASPANSTGCAAGEYLAGETITLTAGPAVGWRVARWTGTANDDTASMSNTVTMPAGEHTAGVAYARIQGFLPMVTFDCSRGPMEYEDNDAYGQANGLLCPGTVNIQGLPNDTWDYFAFENQNTVDVTITVTGHYGTGVQLGLLYHTPGVQPARVATDATQLDGLKIEYPRARAGRYYIVIYTETPKPSETRYYTLQLVTK